MWYFYNLKDINLVVKLIEATVYISHVCSANFARYISHNINSSTRFTSSLAAYLGQILFVLDDICYFSIFIGMLLNF